MSGPCKIAAIRHAVSALHGAADDGADTRRYAEALQETGAAIDELMDEAHRCCDGTGDLSDLRAALTRANGGAA
ncbi:hypothetical protein [Stenotrophomonas indicatrix]|jgi:hypothetical protein|uniref:Uncharacterized protein n=1 Tax=Stenotrophomonas indicatrix TaxID=2045451 RepID=A0A1W1GXG9_9GAMM|nr:hypothetical protein [Stenotrophomonas indicatrix]SLM23941.1 hypothetical protein SAMN04488690_1648 [Stenotrophomonas indicatrix]